VKYANRAKVKGLNMNNRHEIDGNIKEHKKYFQEGHDLITQIIESVNPFEACEYWLKMACQIAASIRYTKSCIIQGLSENNSCFSGLQVVQYYS